MPCLWASSLWWLINMESRSEIRRRLLRARKTAKTHMDAICSADPLTYPLLKQELRQFILSKFLLDEEGIPEDVGFDRLVEESLSHSMKIDPSLVAEFDTAKSCDGATSAMAKKVLLFMTLERELGLQLPALETARVKTLEDISQMVFRTMQNTAVWQSRIK